MSLLDAETRRLGLVLDEAQLVCFQRYYRELLAWNERVNLTRIVDHAAVQVQHFLDSLTCALVLPAVARAPSYAIVDVGTGAGFPGLPLKVLFPRAGLTLVESARKKAAFLQHVVEVLQFVGVEVLVARAEDAGREPEHREAYDLAVSRAVASLPTLAELCLPLVRVGGLFVAFKGRDAQEEVAAAAGALEALGGCLREVRPVHLPGMEGPRHLVVIAKTRPTPERFPRRPGIPKKRPLE
jgi:16S rRNA (guanine527-N7)-methyltransferase